MRRVTDSGARRGPSPLAALVGLVALVVGLYVAAHRSANSDSEAEESARAGLAVTNAALNASMLAGACPGAAGFAALVGLGAAKPEVARQPLFKRVLGWANWVLPMSWPVNAVGAAILAGNAIGHLVLGGRDERARIRSITLDASCGCIVVEGGILYAPAFEGGFSMGVFTFITPGAQSVLPHEAGHALNLAAFGWLFHLTGGWDRKLRRDPMKAYAERLAEGNRPDSRRHDAIAFWRAAE
ncbi:MAG: hypothetical protein Kow0056_09290 [Coriobacteriia bacterium]